jgi:hypothetical protein
VLQNCIKFCSQNSIQVPNGFPLITPFFNEGITQDGNPKGFGCHQGGNKRREKNGVGGLGEGKHIVVIERFLVATIVW